VSCPNPFDEFVQRSEDFLDELYKQTSPLSRFYNLIPRADYKHGAGLTRSVFTIGRSLPTTNTPEFEPVTLTDGETYTGSCGVTYNEVPVGFFEKQYSPEKFGWKGEVICSDDLIYSWQVESFIPAYISAMGKNTMWTIDNRYKAIYDHFVPKAVANTDFAFDTGGTGSPAQAPDLTLDESDCELTQDMLDETANLLIYEGADLEPTSDGWIDYGEDGPLFTLDIGPTMSRTLFRNNAELRQDVRHAYEKSGDMSPLLKRLMSSRRLVNFKHLVNAFPTRYTYAAGEYTEVNTWVADGSATKGQPVKLNPNYVTAPFEAVRVLSPYVFTSEIVRPVNSAGGLSWPAKNYLGDWIFKVGGNNIGEEHCLDPMDKLGRHFAEFAHAPRPVKPLYGRLILFKRCIDDFECISCGS
jgi:hypothetical protein